MGWCEHTRKRPKEKKSGGVGELGCKGFGGRGESIDSNVKGHSVEAL